MMEHHKLCTLDRCHYDCEIAREGEKRLSEFIEEMVDGMEELPGYIKAAVDEHFWDLIGGNKS